MVGYGIAALRRQTWEGNPWDSITTLASNTKLPGLTHVHTHLYNTGIQM